MFKNSQYSKWFLRLFSLAIAIGLWLYVDDLNKKSRHITLEVDFRNKPQNIYSDFNFNNKIIEVEVKGKRDVVNTISSQDIDCYVDLSEAKPGTYSYDIEIKKIHTDVNVIPNEKQVTIYFQPIIEKTVPVKLIHNITTKKMFEITKIKYSPTEVIIRGPEKDISKIKKVDTILLLKKEVHQDFKGKIRFKPLPKNVKIKNADYIMVNVIIGGDKKELRINNVKVILINSSFVPLETTKKNIRLDYIIYKGQGKYINKVDKKQIIAYIDMGKIYKPGTYKLKVVPQDIDKLEIIDFKPKIIKITLRRSRTR